jgi:hypothetical protein
MAGTFSDAQEAIRVLNCVQQDPKVSVSFCNPLVIWGAVAWRVILKGEVVTNR